MRSKYGVPAIAAIAALLAGAAASAAAVRGAADDAEAAVYAARGYPVCLTVNPLVSRGGVVNAEAIEECHCALDRLIADRRASGLSRLDEGNARALLEPYLAQCRGGASGGKVPATAAPPTAQPDGSDSGGKPAIDEGGAAADAGEESGEAAKRAGTEAGAAPPSPSWLAWTGLPAWALWLFPIAAVLAGLVLLLTRRRRDGRGELTGPPPSMRGDAGVGPRPRE